MDMFSLSREAAQYSSMDRKTSTSHQQELTARKQSTFDRRPSGDRRQSYSPNALNAIRDELPAVRHIDIIIIIVVIIVEIISVAVVGRFAYLVRGLQATGRS